MAVGPKPQWVREASEGIDPAALAEEVRRARADGDWVEENRETLKARYSGRFIAVHDRRVVASEDSIPELHRSIVKAGLDPQKCVTEFVLAEEFVWIV